MSHSSHAVNHAPGKPTSSVEPDYIDIQAVLKFGAGLAVVTIGSALLMIWMYKAEVAAVDASNPPRVFGIAVGEDERLPPTPRLQMTPKEDLLDFRAAERTALSSYGWVDRHKGIVRIPVADAMKLTLERGLPFRAQTAGAAPGAAPNAGDKQ